MSSNIRKLEPAWECGWDQSSPSLPSGCTCVLITVVLSAQNTVGIPHLVQISAVTEYQQSQLGPRWRREKEEALAGVA